ncbi:MAG: RNA polymerase subunit sigma-70, partial [Gemmataceae bacterium]|nr:RNA polymerase subunit sigma-70 [Gemmataceae bacterium]
MSDFRINALEQLAEQVRFAPPGVRQEQMERARALREQVRPGRSYPYQFVHFRITNFRTEEHPGLLIE